MLFMVYVRYDKTLSFFRIYILGILLYPLSVHQKKKEKKCLIISKPSTKERSLAELTTNKGSLNHSQKIVCTEPAVYCVYVQNHLILVPSTLLRARNVNKYWVSGNVSAVFDILLPCAVFKTFVYQKYAWSKLFHIWMYKNKNN